MMKKALLSGIALAFTMPVFAEEVEVSGNVTLASEYRWRGVEQTNGDPAIQGGFDLSVGSFYAGTWASNVDFGDDDDTDLELDLYGGFSAEMDNGLSLDIGYLHYYYPSSVTDDFGEVYAGVGYGFDFGLDVGGYLYWDPDNETLYADTSYDYAVNDTFSIGATFGGYLDGFDEYLNWSIGGTFSTPVGVDLSLQYVDNDIDGDAGDEAVVFSISKSL